MFYGNMIVLMCQRVLYLAKVLQLDAIVVQHHTLVKIIFCDLLIYFSTTKLMRRISQTSP